MHLYYILIIFPVNSPSKSQQILLELVPGASEADISVALEKACGDVDEAAQTLLGSMFAFIIHSSQ